MIRNLLPLAAAAAAMPYVLHQARKPSRWLGQSFVWVMNLSHAMLTDWGLKHVRIEKGFSILDVGCGGGRTIQKLAAVANRGRVVGVDYAEASVTVSRSTNAREIRAGRVEIQEASVSRLPFAEGTFDLVTAVETHYYWPDLRGDAREILRVLKPGGTLIVIAESYKAGPGKWIEGLVMTALRAARMSAEEHRAWLAAAGFTDVQVFEERLYGWICVTGTKP